MILIFTDSPDPLRPAAISTALAALGVVAEVRERATGYVLVEGERRWEVRRIRASDLVRELGPRMRDAPTSLSVQLRRVELGYVVPPEPYGPAVATALATLVEGLVCDGQRWARVGAAGLEPVRE